MRSVTVLTFFAVSFVSRTFRTAGFAIYFLVFCGVMSWLLLRPRAAAPRTGTRSPRASLSGAA